MAADGEDYTDGVTGASSDYSTGVGRDKAKEDFENSATEDKADDWSTNAKQATDEYNEGVAEYLGIDVDDMNTTPSSNYTTGIDDDAENDWQSGVSGAGEKWQENAQNSSSKYEENAKDSGEEWAEGYLSAYEPEE